MHSGEETSIIQCWIELAGQEPDSRRRDDCGGSVLVLAEAAKRLPVWNEALRGT
jgi:hypothetical protein